MDKIVIVDDSKVVLDDLVKLLKAAGFSVETANCGEEGIRVIENNQDAAIVVSDLNMRDMTGLEMIECSAEEGIASKIPKIILTTDFMTKKKHEEFMSVKGRDLGIRAWFIKPVTEEKREHFLGVLSALLDEKNGDG